MHSRIIPWKNLKENSLHFNYKNLFANAIYLGINSSTALPDYEFFE